MDNYSPKEIAIKCADIYESLPGDAFTCLDSLVYQVLGATANYSYEDLYAILRYFMDEISKRGIPLVMYKSPGPVNEPIFQIFRKIEKRTENHLPSSNVNIEEPKNVEEFIEEIKQNKQ